MRSISDQLQIEKKKQPADRFITPCCFRSVALPILPLRFQPPSISERDSPRSHSPAPVCPPVLPFIHMRMRSVLNAQENFYHSTVMKKVWRNSFNLTCKTITININSRCSKYLHLLEFSPVMDICHQLVGIAILYHYFGGTAETSD